MTRCQSVANAADSNITLLIQFSALLYDACVYVVKYFPHLIRDLITGARPA